MMCMNCQFSAKIRIELNIEGNPFSGETAIYPGFLRLVNETSPINAH